MGDAEREIQNSLGVFRAARGRLELHTKGDEFTVCTDTFGGALRAGTDTFGGALRAGTLGFGRAHVTRLPRGREASPMERKVTP